MSPESEFHAKMRTTAVQIGHHGTEAEKTILYLLGRVQQLEWLVNTLDISVMHPDMGGNHQATIRANGRRLGATEWDIILSCIPGQEEEMPG